MLPCVRGVRREIWGSSGKQRVDTETYGLTQNVLLEKYRILLSPSSLRFGSFQVRVAVLDLKLQALQPGCPVRAREAPIASQDEDFWWHMGPYIFLFLWSYIHFSVH